MDALCHVNAHLQKEARKAGLDDRLAKLASSLNRSRHRSVADGPRKRRLSEEDQATANERARQRLSSTRAAEDQYAQDS